MADSEIRPRLSLAAAWWVAVVTAIFNALSLLDRSVIAVVLPEIRKDLNLTAFEISVVQGLGFVMFYSIAGVFIGGLVDRYSRRWIMFASITLWSLATAATGLVRNYGEMFVARMTVGFGEASISPAGHSLLAANFPRERLATPLSLMVAAGIGGTGLAYFIGGELLVHFNHTALPAWLGGDLAPWRQVMIAIGLPGLLIAFLAFTVRDPRDAVPKTSQVRATWAEYGRYLGANKRLFGGMMIGYGLTSIVNTATTFWAPTYARTVLGASADTMGVVMMLAIGVAGTLGGVGMGVISDWLTRRGYLDAPLRCYYVSALIGLPVSALGYVADNLTVLYIGVAVFQCTVVACYGALLAGVQSLSPPAMRGRMASTILLTATIGAYALGPIITGWLTTHVFGDPKIGVAVAVTIMIAGPLGAVFFRWAHKDYVARMREVA